MKRSSTLQYTFLIMFSTLLGFKGYAQCGPNVPSFVVDLSSSPSAAFTSPWVQRLDNCCGSTAPDVCVEFVLTLHPMAQGITFEVCDGAVSGGSMFYQIGCGPVIAVGQPVCLNGPGPHYMTFCKPGNNTNVYCITSLPSPSAGPDIGINDGCTGDLTSNGFAPGTVQWTSIFPGPIGTYNNYLGCSTCENTTVAAQLGFPAYVDYQICGNALSPCSSVVYCDTLRVEFFSELVATIVPPQPVVCYGGSGITLTANVNGGTSPYTYLWNTGEISQSIFVSAPGNFDVLVSDISGCPPIQAIITVNGILQPILAKAGADIIVCGDGLPVQLGALVNGATGGIWTNGNGQFLPSNTSLNATYQPSNAEILAGQVDLYLSTTGNSGCPGDSDTLSIIFTNSFQGGSLAATDASCAISSDGAIIYQPVLAGLSYLWNDPMNQTGNPAVGLVTGTYSVLVSDTYGCDTTLTIQVNSPAVVSIPSVTVVDESCAGMNNGTITVSASGGTAPYSYTWDNGASGAILTAGAGTYIVTAVDANNCAPVTATATIGVTGLPNQADAGADQLICAGSLPVQLQGNVTNATGGIWTNGNGQFLPSNTSLNATYQPSGAEILAGQVDLHLTTTGNLSCSSDADMITITFTNSFQGGSLTATNASCAISSDGAIIYQPVLAGLSYLWNDPMNQTGNPAVGLVAGTYSVLVSDTYGCDTTLTAQVNAPVVISIPSVTVVDESCAGMNNGTITVSASGGTAPYSYTWDNGASGAILTAGAGTYIVTAVDANNCAPVTATATIGVTGLPNQADAGADQLVCAGSLPVQLQGNVTNATGGIWSGGQGFFIGSGLNVSYQPSSTELLIGSAELILTTTGNTTCSTDQDTIQITLSNSFLNAQLSSYDLNCNGDQNGSSGYAPALPGLSYQWNDPNSQTTATAFGLAGGDYQLIVTDIDGCDTTLYVHIEEPPVLSIDAIQTVMPNCFGGNNGVASTVVSGGTSGYTYQWSNNTGGQNLSSAVNLGEGTYIVVVTDDNGCIAQGTTTLTSPSEIVLTANVPDTVCINDPIVLSAQASGGTGGIIIEWLGIGFGGSLVYSFPSDQYVTISATDANGCSSPPLVRPVTVLDLQSATLEAYGDTIVCKDGTASVRAKVFDYAAPVFYTWPQLGFSGPGPHTVTVQNDQTLDVIVTDGCASILEEEVQLLVEEPMTIILPEVIEEGCDPLSVQFPSGIVIGATTYNWQLGDGTNSNVIAPMHTYSTGSYSVWLTATSAIGCTATSANSGAVIVHSNPIADFNASPWSTSIENANIQFSNTSGSVISLFDWNFGDGSWSNLQHPDHTYTDAGIFSVELWIQDQNGCENSVIRTVEITPIYDITIPNVFTPDPSGSNGGYYDPQDLSNDVFYPFVEHVEDFNMRIYNRWGELIFESKEITTGWDGYYRGQLSPQDAYVYQIWVRFIDGKEEVRTGDVTLMR